MSCKPKSSKAVSAAQSVSSVTSVAISDPFSKECADLMLRIAARPIGRTRDTRFAAIDVKAHSAHIVRILTRNADGSVRNPKQAGFAPAHRFAQYADGAPLSQALTRGVTEADVKWDVQHGYIALEA